MAETPRFLTDPAYRSDALAKTADERCQEIETTDLGTDARAEGVYESRGCV